VQNDHFDWGFRIASLYGLDYRFTTAKGVFSEQLLKHNREDKTFIYTLDIKHLDEYRVARAMRKPNGR